MEVKTPFGEAGIAPFDGRLIVPELMKRLTIPVFASSLTIPALPSIAYMSFVIGLIATARFGELPVRPHNAALSAVPPIPRSSEPA